MPSKPPAASLQLTVDSFFCGRFEKLCVGLSVNRDVHHRNDSVSSAVLVAPLLDGARNFTGVRLKLESMAVYAVMRDDSVVVPSNSISKQVGRCLGPDCLASKNRGFEEFSEIRRS